jgi:hypothetical protein
LLQNHDLLEKALTSGARRVKTKGFVQEYFTSMMAKEKRRFLLSAPPGRGFRLPSESLLFQGTSRRFWIFTLIDPVAH